MTPEFWILALHIWLRMNPALGTVKQ